MVIIDNRHELVKNIESRNILCNMRVALMA